MNNNYKATTTTLKKKKEEAKQLTTEHISNEKIINRPEEYTQRHKKESGLFIIDKLPDGNYFVLTEC